MLIKFISLCYTVLIWQVSSQDTQCPDTFPEECTCKTTQNDVTITCITKPLETWDIKGTFDAISEVINNNETVVHAVEIKTVLLNQRQEVPANSISTLKTRNLRIYGDWKLTRIDPEAFSGTHDYVEILAVYQMNFTNSQEAFDLFNNFKNIQVIDLWQGSILTSVNARALDDSLQYLTHLYLDDAGLASIGDNAFAGPPSLWYVSMASNSLNLDEISDLAFNFTRSEVILILERNVGLTYLPESKFKNFLTNGNYVYVGDGNAIPNESQYFLHCDERVDWICSIDLTRVLGYTCKEREYVDIFTYCQQNVGSIANA